MKSKINILLLSYLLVSCASVTTGKHQSIAVSTPPETGAFCQLSNDKGTWYINHTPGSVTINRAYSDLTVACKKDNKVGTLVVKSSIKGMTAGNIILGGVIGLAVDAGTGAGYDYPTLITVPLF